MFSEMLVTSRILHKVSWISQTRVTRVRLLSSSGNLSDQMSVMMIKKTGVVEEKMMTMENILQTLPRKIPLRDIRLLLRTHSSSSNVKKIPSLLPRPSSNCYILDIEHLRVLCLSDKVRLSTYLLCACILSRRINHRSLESCKEIDSSHSDLSIFCSSSSTRHSNRPHHLTRLVLERQTPLYRTDDTIGQGEVSVDSDGLTGEGEES